MPRRYLFRLLSAVPPGGDHVPDIELLRRYAAKKDAAAFELLVRRHADAVWAACFRVLRNDADAEDAFQTAFVVLARKADAVRGSCVGGWLHRVAVNTALRLVASRERERAGSWRTPSVSGGVQRNPLAHARGSPDTLAEHAELAAVVHQELARLPDRYRLPVVLCDLEGHTHAEAAKVLNWPVGSVSGRLSRARDILRDRLTRRGVTAPAALAAVLSAGPPLASAVSAASAVAVGTVPVSPVVSTLTEGVLSAMRTAKLRLTAALAAGLLGLAGAGTVIGLAQAPAPRTPGEQPPKTAEKSDPQVAKIPDDFTAFPDLKKLPEWTRDKNGEPDVAAYDRRMAELCPRLLGGTPVTFDPTDDTYRKLLKARIEQGRQEVLQIRQQIRVGRWTSGDFAGQFQGQDDMRAAVTELYANDPKNLIPWLEEFIILAREWERFSESRVGAGTDPPWTVNVTRRHRLKVEAALWKAKNAQRQGGAGGPGR
jgi:RNA polymerase sigma factor (sigma-70 family)